MYITTENKQKYYKIYTYMGIGGDGRQTIICLSISNSKLTCIGSCDLNRILNSWL